MDSPEFQHFLRRLDERLDDGDSLAALELIRSNRMYVSIGEVREKLWAVLDDVTDISSTDLRNPYAMKMAMRFLYDLKDPRRLLELSGVLWNKGQHEESTTALTLASELSGGSEGADEIVQSSLRSRADHFRKKNDAGGALAFFARFQPAVFAVEGAVGMREYLADVGQRSWTAIVDRMGGAGDVGVGKRSYSGKRMKELRRILNVYANIARPDLLRSAIDQMERLEKSHRQASAHDGWDGESWIKLIRQAHRSLARTVAIDETHDLPMSSWVAAAQRSEELGDFDDVVRIVRNHPDHDARGHFAAKFLGHGEFALAKDLQPSVKDMSPSVRARLAAALDRALDRLQLTPRKHRRFGKPLSLHDDQRREFIQYFLSMSAECRESDGADSAS